MARPLPARLFFIADCAQAPEGLPALVGRAVRAGVRFIELRRKSPLGTADRVSEARACLAAATDAVVLVNDRADVALAAGAGGVHVGQGDLPARAVRRLVGEERWLGLSTHDEAQFEAATDLPLDYIALGPIHESTTKRGHAPPVGLARLRRCCASTPRPVVAIGGLDPEGARRALEAGASAVAVASGLSHGRLEENVESYLRACS